MEQQTKPTHTLKAWTYPMDFVPHLYVGGSITTNGEDPLVSLHEKEPQGIVPEDLLMEFKPDVYDPKGSSTLDIENFSKAMIGVKYTSVTILAKKGDIHLKVEERTRGSKTE